MRCPVPRSGDLRVQGKRPAVPAGLRIYAIGDLHGRLDLLNKLLSLINEDVAEFPTARTLYLFLGDYVDRGRWSRETIDRLIELGAAHEAVFLKGNHELIALSCLSDQTKIDQWLYLGGMETLRSYGVPPELFANRKQVARIQRAFHEALPRSHLLFFRDLKNSFVSGDFFFAHAGVKPGVELGRQTERDLLWIRDEFLLSKKDFGKIVIHGHTPAERIDVRPNRINIDTGAFATERLTCLVIEGDTLAMIDTAPA